MPKSRSAQGDHLGNENPGARAREKSVSRAVATLQCRESRHTTEGEAAVGLPLRALAFSALCPNRSDALNATSLCYGLSCDT